MVDQHQAMRLFAYQSIKESCSIRKVGRRRSKDVITVGEGPALTCAIARIVRT